MPVLSVSYVGNQNRHQNDYRETNLPVPTVLPSIIAGTTNIKSVVPYLGFGSIKMSENAQNSHYNSLQVNFHSRMRKDLTLQVAYTLSRSIDPSSGDLSNVSNPYNRAYDIGPSPLDRTHIGLVNFIYDIPIFKSSSNRALKTALGGWELAAIGTMETGLPLNITLGGSQGSNGLPNATNRPDFSGTVSYPQTVGQWFSPSGFSVPAVGQWGNMKRGIVRGPGRDNWNISLFKSFMFSEQRGSRLELRVESFNSFNHTQFNGVSSTFTNSNFGQVTSVWDPRVFQMGTKLYSRPFRAPRFFRVNLRIRQLRRRPADSVQHIFLLVLLQPLQNLQLRMRFLLTTHRPVHASQLEMRIRFVRVQTDRPVQLGLRALIFLGIDRQDSQIQVRQPDLWIQLHSLFQRLRSLRRLLFAHQHVAQICPGRRMRWIPCDLQAKLPLGLFILVLLPK